MTAATREQVRRRANDCCEYCRLPQSASPFASFHVEHVTSRQHRGTDELGNLALACDRCNLYKGPNLSAIDEETGTTVRLFDPRSQMWSHHFRQVGFLIEGRTAIGRATVQLLNMNASGRVRLRVELQLIIEP